MRIPWPLGVLSFLPRHLHQVRGDSMAPTLTGGQLIVTRPVRVPDERLDRGDLALFRETTRGDSVYVKRIIGLPNEYIELRDSGVYIDDSLLDESYLRGPACPDKRYARRWYTGPDEYFVMGDNRTDSRDSRAFGPVSLAHITGKVWFRCWPPKLIPEVKHDD